MGPVVFALLRLRVPCRNLEVRRRCRIVEEGEGLPFEVNVKPVEGLGENRAVCCVKERIEALVGILATRSVGSVMEGEKRRALAALAPNIVVRSIFAERM